MSKIETKVKEAILVRGICSSIQAMNMPSLDAVKDVFKQAGYTIIIQKD